MQLGREKECACVCVCVWAGSHITHFHPATTTSRPHTTPRGAPSLSPISPFQSHNRMFMLFLHSLARTHTRSYLGNDTLYDGIRHDCLLYCLWNNTTSNRGPHNPHRRQNREEKSTFEGLHHHDSDCIANAKSNFVILEGRNTPFCDVLTKTCAKSCLAPPLFRGP
jgi:hypothetical protein